MDYSRENAYRGTRLSESQMRLSLDIAVLATPIFSWFTTVSYFSFPFHDTHHFFPKINTVHHFTIEHCISWKPPGPSYVILIRPSIVLHNIEEEEEEEEEEERGSELDPKKKSWRLMSTLSS